MDSIITVLIEHHADRHRLHRDGTEFDAWNSLFPWTNDIAESTAIYRYALVDSALETTVNVHDSFPFCPLLNFSFRFREETGPDVITINNGCLTGESIEAEHRLLTYIGTAVEDRSDAPLPSELRLEQNYPNPFNPSTSISFSVPGEGPVRLRVFDLLGREIATIADATLSPGTYVARWDASAYASGVYLLRLESAGSVRTRLASFLR
jgi:hypothetical protein